MRMSTRWWRAAVAAFGLAAVLVAACGGATMPAAPTTTTASTPLTGTISVFAASSLTEVFKTIAADFQRANPGVTVEFNFAASSALATQIDQAAPADVFASADATNMTRLADKSQIDGTPVTFAKNLPVIVIPADNKAGIAGPKDLAKPGTKFVLAGPDVPIGNYARQIIDRLAATPEYGAAYRDATLKNVVSNEQNVRAVLTKIELGEADAGIVYQTDALVAREKVKTVAIPEAANVIAVYPIAVVKTAKNKAAAAAFIKFVTGAPGQAALKAAGFDAAS